jgi:hypothetical protein
MACLRSTCQHIAYDHRGTPDPILDPHPCHACECEAYEYDTAAGESPETFEGGGGGFGGGGASGGW